MHPRAPNPIPRADSPRSLMAALAIGAAAVVGSACTLAGEDPLESGYKTATLSVVDPTGVADGRTAIEVRVSGTPSIELTLEVIGAGASFAADDGDTGQEKTVYLQAQSDTGEPGLGVATAGVITTQPGIVTVALKADSARTAQELDFEPVRMAVVPAVPTRLEPGLVMHQVCVAINTAEGTLQVDTLDVPGAENLNTPGSFTPSSLPIRAQMPDGVTCPEDPVDVIGWQGYSVFTWGTPVDFAQVTLSYLGPDGAPLAAEILALNGEPFAGYTVVDSPPEANDSWTSIDMTLSYPATGPLPGGPAAGVKLQDIRFIPDNGPTFLGSSSGSAEEQPVTDLSGRVVLFFDTAVAPGTYALFVTPENGATEYLTDIEIL